MAVDRTRTIRGAAAGAVAAGVWAAQMPLDKRVFQSDFDDVELLGKLITRGPAWPLAGLALHVQNGALFGATYAALAPRLPLPSWARGPLAAIIEHFSSWPLTAFIDRLHPARDELPPAVRQRARAGPGHVAPPAVRRRAGGSRAPAQRRARGGGAALRARDVLQRPRQPRARGLAHRLNQLVRRRALRSAPAGVAQLVEHSPCKRRVSGSSPLSGSYKRLRTREFHGRLWSASAASRTLLLAVVLFLGHKVAAK